MSRLCTDQLELILWLSVGFLAASLLIGAIGALLALKPKPAETDRTQLTADNVQQIGPILTALKGVIEALSNAPAWFALFLAGLFLFWLAGETYVNACKPAPPITRSITTSNTTTVITRTAPRAQ